MRTAQILQMHPDWISDGDAAPIDAGITGDLVAQYGDAIGSQISQMSLQIAQGSMTRGQAIKQVMADQNLARALFDAASKGLISIDI